MYSIVGVVTVIAAVVFVSTYVKAVVYVSDSGSLGTIDVSQAESQGYVAVSMSTEATSTTAAAVAASTSAETSSTSSHISIPTKPKYIPPDFPAHLSIPSLAIEASVQELGLKANGDLGSPSNFVDVGWYAAGTIPGKTGSAIIDGHVDNGLALSGVFKHLTDVAVGDDVYITTHGGAKLHFIVTDIQSFDYKNAPLDLIYNQDNGIYLKLITCGGSWVPGDRTYDRRIVVTTILAK
jgi:sortase (surface protein transpeptidase)